MATDVEALALEVLVLKGEALELRILNRKHRTISEATEAELRATQHQLQHAQDLLAKLITSIEKPECQSCRKLLAEIEKWLQLPVE